MSEKTFRPVKVKMKPWEWAITIVMSVFFGPALFWFMFIQPSFRFVGW